MEDNQPTPISQQIIYKELFRDRPLVVMSFLGILAALITSVRVMLTTTHYDIHIPVRYTEFGGVDNYITGDWYTHFEFVAFAAIIVVINTLLALRIYRHRRWISMMVLSLQLFVMLFLWIVSGAIINTLPVAG